MAWADVQDLRALVFTDMTDDELSDILELAQDFLEVKTGTVSAPTDTHKMACLFQSAAFLLNRMKTNGELSYTNKIGTVHQINEKIDDRIAEYQTKADSLIQIILYRTTSDLYSAFYQRAKPLHRDDPDE